MAYQTFTGNCNHLNSWIWYEFMVVWWYQRNVRGCKQFFCGQYLWILWLQSCVCTESSSAVSSLHNFGALRLHKALWEFQLWVREHETLLVVDWVYARTPQNNVYRIFDFNLTKKSTDLFLCWQFLQQRIVCIHSQTICWSEIGPFLQTRCTFTSILI